MIVLFTQGNVLIGRVALLESDPPDILIGRPVMLESVPPDVLIGREASGAVLISCEAAGAVLIGCEVSGAVGRCSRSRCAHWSLRAYIVTLKERVEPCRIQHNTVEPMQPTARVHITGTQVRMCALWQPGPNTSGQVAQRRGGGWCIPPISTSRHQRASIV